MTRQSSTVDPGPGLAGLDRTPLVGSVLTVSDEVASGADTDRGGPVALAGLAEHGVRAASLVVPDDPGRIRAAVLAELDAGARVLLVCGGTGIGPRDRTSAVIRELLAFEIPGIAEEIRRRGSHHTRLALVSREVAGIVVREGCRPALVIAAPGSRGGIRDTLGVVGDLIGYILDQVDGAGHS